MAGIRISKTVLIDDQGRVIVGYRDTSDNTTLDYKIVIARYLSNGSIDPSFGSLGKVILGQTGNGLRDDVFYLHLQSDGKILVAGNTSNPDGTVFSTAIHRVTSAGQLDSTFGSNGSVYVDTATGNDEGSLILDYKSGNRYLIAGKASNANEDVGLVVLNPSGIPDTSFGTSGATSVNLGTGAGVFKSSWTSPAAYGDYIYILQNTDAGAITKLARVTPGGGLDANFGAGSGIVIVNSTTQTGIVLDDGKIITVEQPNAFTLRLRAYTPVGIPITSWGDGGGILDISNGTNTIELQSIEVDANGKILVAGNFITAPGGGYLIARATASDGRLDTTFDSDGIFVGTTGTGSGTRTAFSLAANGSLTTYTVAPLTTILGAGASPPSGIAAPTVVTTAGVSTVGYSISPSTASVNEGSSAVFTVSTTNVSVGTSFTFTVGGVSSGDITGPMTGTAAVGSNGQATITIPIVADQTVEGPETMTLAVPNASASITINDTSVCLAAGTMVSTRRGYCLVESLQLDDFIRTCEDIYRRVLWIGYQRRTPEFARFQDYLPVKISAGALDDNVPLRDLYLSPDHAVLVDGHLIHAKALVNGKTIVQMTEWAGDIEYYHIETEGHEIIYAEGVPCETFIDNVSRRQFDNYDEYEAMFGDERVMTELDLPRVKFKRQLPQAIAQRLEVRAQALAIKPKASDA